MKIEFTEDEIETIKDLILDCGNDCPSSELWEKRQALGEKLDVLEPEKPLTEEEIKSREEFAESPMGLVMSAMFKQANEYLIAQMLEQKDSYNLMTGEQWSNEEVKLLKINLPKDFKI